LNSKITIKKIKELTGSNFIQTLIVHTFNFQFNIIKITMPSIF
jgi:hypothetical protein